MEEPRREPGEAEEPRHEEPRRPVDRDPRRRLSVWSGGNVWLRPWGA